MSQDRDMGHPVWWLFGGGGWGGHDRVVLCGQLGCGLDVGCGWVFGLPYFYSEYVTWTEHIAGEEDVFFVRREADVGFGAVVVVGHVDEAFGFEDAGLE